MQGWHATHVSEVGLDRADDLEILEYARRNGFACVTLDHDFHSHLALSMSGSPSVVLLRIEGLGIEQQVKLIRSVWDACGAAIATGAAVSADGISVRFRKLPLL